ncbi:hypothetical protein MMO39_04820 [Acinetobacter modestus]|uniref:hypothetical protein n=1 Tax=Acinetobacter modestus TaxID=1776740 RepID=UPI001F4A5EFF|nr:hypothetical protein [Acinetobacter modestus]MCH7331836.1 hypothetical protein [Acinetobacter modestus]MCH7386624.1 hypothetical protein [Acinetobacter modestus]
MNKFLLLGLVSLLLSVNVFAYETRSMRSSTELVTIGESESSLIQKMGKSKPRFFVYEDGRFSCAATEYKYDIDMQEYTVLVCRGQIFKIDVKNK